MKLFPKIRIYKNKSSLLSLVLNLSLLFLVLYPFFQPQKANATVTEAFVRFDRLATGAAISGTACLKTGTTGTEASVVIVFPTGWTISSTASNWTVTTTNLPTDPIGGGAATAWQTIGSPASSVSGLSVVFSSGDLTPATFYCFNFAGASSTVGAAANDQTGQLKTRDSVAALIDTVNYATSVVASGADQITITASVSATMTFSLSANSIALGTLSTSTPVSGTVTQTVSTNAADGFVSWIKGTNWNGLYSPTANAMIFSPGAYPQIGDLTQTSGKGYGLDAQPGTNAPVIAAGYQGSATTIGHIDSAQFRQVASLTGPQSGTTVTLNVRTEITATQSAALDYSDTLTVVAAGSF